MAVQADTLGDAVRSTWIGTVTLEWLREQDAPPVLVHKGGTQSGKTYNACIAWATYLSNHPGEQLSIVRATNPALKSTVWADMKEVLQRMGLYHPDRHNKSDQRFEFRNGSEIDYFPSDDSQKVHGRKREHVWANEANELSLAKWDQLDLRTRQRAMLDFNPSFQSEHWIWQRFQGNPHARWYTSTYEDNDYLPDEQRRKIEKLKERDEWKWNVYGLGQQQRPASSIYKDVQGLSQWPHENSVLGLDFGYNDPMSLNRVAVTDREGKPTIDVWCLLHESHLTTQDLIDDLPDLGVGKGEVIVCDSAEPDRIEQLRRAGYNAKPARKGQGSVEAGIDMMQGHTIRVGGPVGHRARQEFKGYHWKVHNATDEVLDEPADDSDHAPDAVRYAAVTEDLLPETTPLSADHVIGLN
jgi:phage terminase large subunit